MRATLVGGGAIEFHAPAAHTTTDIDLVVEPSDRRAMGEAFAELGFERRGRHWVREEVFVEVPGTRMRVPAEEFPVGPFILRVVRKEVALADRVIGYKHWKVTDYGAQAIAMIRAFGEELDQSMLRASLRGEDSEDAYDVLSDLARADLPITQQRLHHELERLHGRE